MISVIIPTYNRSNTIKRSIVSVLEQTIKDIEVIIVDDGSSDNTQEVVESIQDDRIRYVKLLKNSGACAARNHGIEISRGEYIAFQDSDDEWLPEKLEKQICVIKELNADVCFCLKRRISLDGSKKDVVFKKYSEGIVPYHKLLSGSISTQTIVAKSEVFKNIRFDPNVKRGQDYEWAIRAGKKYIFALIQEALVNQYIQSDSITTNKNHFNIEADMSTYFYDKFKNEYKNDPRLREILLLRKAKTKTMADINAYQDFKELYYLTKNKKILLYMFLSKINLLHIILLSRYKKGNKVLSI